MEKKAGCFTLWTKDNGRKIIFARGEGTPAASEVAEFADSVLEVARQWNGEPWALLFYIDKMNPVSEEGSRKYVEMHERFSANQCKNLAYVDGHTYEVSVQSSRHTARSGVKGTQHRYFETEDEALSWLASAGF